MLASSNLPISFCAEAISIVCFTQNRPISDKGFQKTSYELIDHGRPNVNILHVFGYKCYILNDGDHLGMFDKKADEEIIFGCSLNTKAFFK